MTAATIAAAAAGATASPTAVLGQVEKCKVRINDKSTKEIYQFSTNEEGDLSVSAVTAIIPGTNCLKFKDVATGVTTVCRQVGEVFEVPAGGWGDRTYDANVPPPPPPVSSSNNNHVNFPIGGIGAQGIAAPNPAAAQLEAQMLQAHLQAQAQQSQRVFVPRFQPRFQ